MTTNEIIEILKSNEKGFMFLPKEVQEWMEEHKRDIAKYSYFTHCFDGTVDTLCENHVYRLRPDNEPEEEVKFEYKEMEGIFDFVKESADGKIYIKVKRQKPV